MAIKNAEILLIEDNIGDAHLMHLMLGECETHCSVQIIDDGSGAMDYLLQRGKYSSAIRPDLILMDLNLPKMDGREVLKAIKGDPNLRQIPVMILTSSTAEEDIFTSYDLGANCYLIKPMTLNELGGLTRKIDDFWLGSVLLPNRKLAGGARARDTHGHEENIRALDQAS